MARLISSKVRRSNQRVRVFAAMLLTLGVAAIATSHEAPLSSEPIQPIPLPAELDRRKVELGKKLFLDPRLSRSNTMSCAFCHQLAQGGDDGLPQSITNNGEPDSTNAPTVFNAVFNFRQTWRGEFHTLEQQAEADLLNPRHANTTWEELLPKLRADRGYASVFGEIYRGGVNRESVLDAIATYERSLTTPNSRFDQYLRGKRDAISEREKKGYSLFKSYGCISCHQGMNVGGNMFQKFGILGTYLKDRGRVTKADLGRFNVTGNEADRYVFKVPGLRNVAVTAPYFHDGSAKDLEQAIRLMARVQLGLSIPDEDIAYIADFMSTLTGEYQGRRLKNSAGTLK